MRDFVTPLTSMQRPSLVLFGKGHACTKANRLPVAQQAKSEGLNMMTGTPKPPLCPSCVQPMRLVRTTSRFGDLPDLYTFECRACGVLHVEADEAATSAAIPIGFQ
jgi:hypothetical protein